MFRPNRNIGSPAVLLLLGFIMLAIAAGLPKWTGTRPDAGADFFLTLLGGFGALTAFGGVAGFWHRRMQAERRNAAEQTSGLYGEARFATAEDCEAAGLFDPNGLYVGMMDGEPLFYDGSAHVLNVAPARSGKGIGGVIPNLLHYRGSVLVSDPKGELSATTGSHRRDRFGQKTVVFKPWGLHGLPQHRINPLQNLPVLASDERWQRGLADEAKAITLQLLAEPEDARNKYFRDGSRGIKFTTAIYLALFQPDRCTLPEMWRIISSPRRLMRMAQEMAESDALGGLCASLGEDLLSQMQDNPDQFADFRAGALQALDIYQPGSYLGAAVSGSDVDLADLKNGETTIYLAFPPERMASHGAALGLIVNQAIAAVSRSPEKGEVLFLLDEFANLGKLSGLAESLTALPGLGVRVFMIVQELAELIRLYGPHTTQTILSQSEVKQFFAVNVAKTAEELSKTLGQKTVLTRSYNLGRNEDDDIGESLSETGQPLMRPEEIILMGSDEQLLFVNGLPPIRAQRVPFWFVQPWGSWAAPNPVEGSYPAEEPLVRLSYRAESNLF